MHACMPIEDMNKRCNSCLIKDMNKKRNVHECPVMDVEEERNMHECMLVKKDEEGTPRSPRGHGGVLYSRPTNTTRARAQQNRFRGAAPPAHRKIRLPGFLTLMDQQTPKQMPLSHKTVRRKQRAYLVHRKKYYCDPPPPKKKIARNVIMLR